MLYQSVLKLLSVVLLTGWATMSLSQYPGSPFLELRVQMAHQPTLVPSDTGAGGEQYTWGGVITDLSEQLYKYPWTLIKGTTETTQEKTVDD